MLVSEPPEPSAKGVYVASASKKRSVGAMLHGNDGSLVSLKTLK